MQTSMGLGKVDAQKGGCGIGIWHHGCHALVDTFSTETLPVSYFPQQPKSCKAQHFQLWPLPLSVVESRTLLVFRCLRKLGSCSEDIQSTRHLRKVSRITPETFDYIAASWFQYVPIAFAKVALSIRIHRSDSFRALRVHGSSMLKPCRNMIQPSKSSRSSNLHQNYCIIAASKPSLIKLNPPTPLWR